MINIVREQYNFLYTEISRYGEEMKEDTLIGIVIVIVVFIVLISIGMGSLHTILLPKPRVVTTTRTFENMLLIHHAVFYTSTDPYRNRMNVTLSYRVRNIGDQDLVVTAIAVPDADFEKKVIIIIKPGECYEENITILTNIPYSDEWMKGTDHVVTFIYHVVGEDYTRTISIKAIVKS